MADKEMTERSVLAEKISDAVLMICLFHTLRTFHREIASEKMGINAAQRIIVLETISKLDKEEYMKFYQLLKESNLKQVINILMTIDMESRNNGWRGLSVKHATI